MFGRVLVANRGEIALRIIRCLRMMDIESVLVYSTADKDSLPVQLATYPICIGPAPSSKSYLNQDAILDVAVRMECDALHPGYGFLSENAGFARRCEELGIKFIGPSADIIDRMGDKQAARELMIKSNVPVVPGSKSLVTDADMAAEIADKLGYPVLIKASGGGGGKGMRKAFSKAEIKNAFESARSEAIASFGNGDMYIEKLILEPHHIEFQIVADNFGNVVHLGERECSIQRRNQKMIEESPSHLLTDEVREKMGAVAVKAAKAAGYASVGTIEFVVDEDLNYYFIEMNTRIQVEHPVTEMVSGIDLIKEQIRIAAGLKLSFSQEDVKLCGHAIECRINAENPANSFLPNPGKIKFVHFPAGNGIRVESAVYNGYEINPFYDSMVAKVIAYGNTRLEAIRKLRAALEELVIDGVTTNANFQYIMLYHPLFIKGKYNTSFLEKHIDEIMEWEPDKEN